MWVKFRRTKHHRFVFSICKCKPFAWCWEGPRELQVHLILDSLPNCTQARTEPRGWPEFLWSSTLVLSCPLGQYPAWSEQQKMSQNCSLGGRHGFWARQKQEETLMENPLVQFKLCLHQHERQAWRPRDRLWSCLQVKGNLEEVQL